MSKSEITLVCNYKKCRVPLNTSAWATICSHIFCDNDGNEILNREKQCPYCNKILKKPLDIIQINLNPDESFKSMVLCGLKPEIVMDISLRAVTFWNHQMTQEKIIQTTNTHTKRLQEKFEYDKKQYSIYSKKVNAALKDAELQRQRIREIEEKLVKNNRILHHVQAKYERLKSQITPTTVQSAKPLNVEGIHRVRLQPKSFENHKSDEFFFAPIF